MLRFGNATISTIRTTKNLPALVNMARDVKMSGGEGGDNETVKYTYAKNYQRLQTKLLSGLRKALILINFYNSWQLKEYKLLSSPRDLRALLFSFFALIMGDLFGYQYFSLTASLLLIILQISFIKLRLTCNLLSVKVAVLACRGGNCKSHLPIWRPN